MAYTFGPDDSKKGVQWHEDEPNDYAEPLPPVAGLLMALIVGCVIWLFVILLS